MNREQAGNLGEGQEIRYFKKRPSNLWFDRPVYTGDNPVVQAFSWGLSPAQVRELNNTDPSQQEEKTSQFIVENSTKANEKIVRRMAEIEGEVYDDSFLAADDSLAEAGFSKGERKKYLDQAFAPATKKAAVAKAVLQQLQRQADFNGTDISPDLLNTMKLMGLINE